MPLLNTSGTNTTRGRAGHSVSESKFSRAAVYALLVYAVIQSVVGLAFWDIQPAEEPNILLRGISLALFLAVGLYLVANTRADGRLLYLGTSLVLIAVAFASGALRYLTPDFWVGFVRLPSDVFLPFVLFTFFLSWPRNTAESVYHLVFLRFLLTAGLVLFGVNLLIALGVALPPTLLALDHLADGTNDTDLVDAFSYSLTFLVLPLLIYRTWRAGPEEKARAVFFVSVLALTISMPCGFIMWVALQEAVNLPRIPPTLFENLRITFNVILLLNPVAVTYAVIVDEIVPIKYVVRQSVRFLLGQYTVLLLGALPFVLLAANIYVERNRTISEVLADPETLIYLLLAVVGYFAIRQRERIVRQLERRFFRDRYVLETAISQVMRLGHNSASPAELGVATLELLEDLLKPEFVELCLLRSDSGQFTSVRGTSTFQMSDAVVNHLAGIDQPVVYQKTTLEPSLRDWMIGAEVHVLMPIHAQDGKVLAVVAIGRKRSQEKYGPTDSELFGAVVNSLQLAFGSVRMSRMIHAPAQVDGSVGDSSALARLCEGCKQVYSSAKEECCGAATRLCSIPPVINDRFRLEGLMGRGSSGEVFRALDLELRREVAVKCLGRTTPGEARVFRRESVATAAFSSPYLAAIYDTQLYDGLPVLIFELMPGGSLADHLQASGKLSIAETLRLGSAVGLGLDYLHRRGSLHRDIKPANIGFTAERDAKLLDFGLARATVTAAIPGVPDVQTQTMRSTYSTGHCVGTPLYWAPEVLLGKAPDAASDVWALCVVLYEALTGCHPFECGTWHESASAILDGERRPGLFQHAPAALVETIASGLSRTRQERPTAGTLAAALINLAEGA